MIGNKPATSRAMQIRTKVILQLERARRNFAHRCVFSGLWFFNLSSGYFLHVLALPKQNTINDLRSRLVHYGN